MTLSINKEIALLENAINKSNETVMSYQNEADTLENMVDRLKMSIGKLEFIIVIA